MMLVVVGVMVVVMLLLLLLLLLLPWLLLLLLLLLPWLLLRLVLRLVLPWLLVLLCGSRLQDGRTYVRVDEGGRCPSKSPSPQDRSGPHMIMLLLVGVMVVVLGALCVANLTILEQLC